MKQVGTKRIKWNSNVYEYSAATNYWEIGGLRQQKIITLQVWI